MVLALRTEADQGEIRVEELGGLAGDQVQALLETERHEDLLDDFSDRLDVSQALAGLLVESRVIEGQGRLVGKGLEESHLDLGEDAARAVGHREGADGAALDPQRHRGECADPGLFDAPARHLGEPEAWIGVEIGGDVGLPVGDDAPGDADPRRSASAALHRAHRRPDRGRAWRGSRQAGGDGTPSTAPGRGVGRSPRCAGRSPARRGSPSARGPCARAPRPPAGAASPPRTGARSRGPGPPGRQTSGAGLPPPG